jgi:hypothetical protein
VVLLLIAGWSVPEPPPSFPDRPEIIGRATIRIISERKWPEKIVMDTSKPTMTPDVAIDALAAREAVPLPSAEALDQPRLEAMAQLKPDAHAVAIDRPILRINRNVARTVRSRHVSRASITHRLARAKKVGGCCQFNEGQASLNAMPSRRAASSWPFE